ncbi:hypothetical protein SteCoe_10827 [Stentor coeruleus]|uniref:RING-CH-type domain-containing protein n=1 Tax=Stentor coeruleus TaxID=5963 RepID=A0A1R2CEQ1_9CILI|nr:hypothetical protein SteCoe_10827 [Stentor coeruleus]
MISSFTLKPNRKYFSLSFLSPKNKIYPTHSLQDSQVILKSQNNTPLRISVKSPLIKDQTFRFSSAELLREKAQSIKFPCISPFSGYIEERIQDNNSHEDNIEVQVQDPQCRICLEINNIIDMISPCHCNGSLKYVHQHCLKLWLLKSDKSEIDISSCEVCKTKFVMNFKYSHMLTPCNEYSCKSWLPFLISCVMIIGILSFYYQGYFKSDSQGIMIIVISVIFSIIGLTCLILSGIKMSQVCIEKKVNEWSILNFPEQGSV